MSRRLLGETGVAPQRRRRRAFAVVGGPLVVVTYVALAVLAWRHELARPGTSAAYWDHLCRVRLPGFAGHPAGTKWGGVYPIIDGNAYYYEQLEHRQNVYMVPVASVLQDAASVRAALADARAAERSSDRDAARDDRRQACATMLRAFDGAALDAQQLEALRVAVGGVLPLGVLWDDAASRGRAMDDGFRGWLARGNRAWAAAAFEAAYLGAWLWFVAGRRPLRVHWRWRALLAPFLLFVPFFLGYAPRSLTFAPSGGFVYPAYVFFVALPMAMLPCFGLDAAVQQHLPMLLDGISLVSGDPRAESSLGCVGPLSTLALGAALLLLLSIASTARRHGGRERAMPRSPADGRA